MDSPTSAYEKTQPFEACTFFIHPFCAEAFPCSNSVRVLANALLIPLCFVASAGAGKLKARFENMAKASDEENRKRAEEEKARRRARESRERELAKHRQEEVCTVNVEGSQD